MKLTDLRGNYDGIYSLGDLCLASIQLKKNNLRPYSGVLDWMGSPQLSDVNRLLMNRFEGFMDRANLRVVGEAGDRLLVAEERYGILSNHDFPRNRNTAMNLASYPEVKQKFDRRIGRMLDHMNSCRRILFVRTEGDFQDAWDLQEILSALVTHEYRVLLVNHAQVEGIVELDWPLEKICAVQLPDKDKWSGNDPYWTVLLNGIRLI